MTGKSLTLILSFQLIDSSSVFNSVFPLELKALYTSDSLPTSPLSGHFGVSQSLALDTTPSPFPFFMFHS